MGQFINPMETQCNPANAARKTPTANEILQEFRGHIAPVPASLLYRVGLLVVTVGMALLPLLYVAIIVAVAGLVTYHAIVNVSMFSRRASFRGILLGYFGPIIAGLILIVFLMKPLFAQRAKRLTPQSLGERDEPLVFTFITRICEVVGAPMPVRVDLDLNVNASASFRHGFLSFLGNDLVLTLGLPLVAGLSMRELAGVLAHEFGHFGQRFGMRSTYVIGAVSHWFERVVYERDLWDELLAAAARQTRYSIPGVILNLARFCVWLSRRLLWALMMVGRGMSALLLRQMEFNADRYEARLAGSQAFSKTASKLLRLHFAEADTRQRLNETWLDRRLGDNYVSLVLVRAQDLTKEMEDMIHHALCEEKTGWFDTHPADADRIREAQAEQADGIFHLERPATDLFSDFSDLSHRATLGFYREALGSEFTEQSLVPTDDLVRSMKRQETHRAAAEQFFCGVLPGLHAFGSCPKDIDLTTSYDVLVETIKQTRGTMSSLAGVAREAMAHFDSAESNLREADQAQTLLDAKMRPAKRTFRIPVKNQESVARAVGDAQQKQREAADILAPFYDAAWARLRAALQLLQTPAFATRVPEADALLARARHCLPALRTYFDVIPLVNQLEAAYVSLLVLVRNASTCGGTQAFDSELHRQQYKVHQIHNDILAAFSQVAYPFEHAAESISVSRYLCERAPDPTDVDEVGAAAYCHLERLPVMYLRLLGSLADVAEHVESALGLPPLHGDSHPTNPFQSLPTHGVG
ncbi:MAG: M48 family metallopeptidase [Candidatus Hydrogenedentes bacterium]|nr:M48 family metallopeptidase [Candidatus Hydrogenedentota bacterium]